MPYTEEGMRRYLRQQGYSSAVIEEVLDARAEDQFERQREDRNIPESQHEDLT